MFSSDFFGSSVAAQTMWGRLNTRLTAVCSVGKKSKKTKKNKILESHTMAHAVQKSKKRKWTEVLNEPGSNVKSSDPNCRRLECISLDTTQLRKAKRVKTATHGKTNKLDCNFCDNWEMDSGFSSEVSPPASGRSSPALSIQPSMLVAMDCEMVGTGPNGHCSELARCSLINYSGTVIYDKYVKPCQPVTDYRTRWSGIRKKHLLHALPFSKARKEILQILKGKVVIGHALNHDFAVLDITIPHHMIRDTSSMLLLRQMCGFSDQSISLKKLSRTLLSRNIQVGRKGHCSVEDARAALDLYKLVEQEWEKSLQGPIQNSDRSRESTSCLQHYMQDQYWPENLTDCDE